MGNLLTVLVTLANKQDRVMVVELAAQVQEATGETVEVSFVDQGYMGETAVRQAEECGIRLEVVKLAEAKKNFMLLPRRWVVE